RGSKPMFKRSSDGFRRRRGACYDRPPNQEGTSMKFTTIGAFCAALALAACNGAGPDAAAPQAETAAPDAGALLDGAIAGDQRTAEDRARDAWRHPKETLEFFGVEPSMTVVEIWPGGGWYAKILASYLKAGGGVYYAAHVDPAASERAAER